MQDRASDRLLSIAGNTDAQRRNKSCSVDSSRSTEMGLVRCDAKPARCARSISASRVSPVKAMAARWAQRRQWFGVGSVRFMAPGAVPACPSPSSTAAQQGYRQQRASAQDRTPMMGWCQPPDDHSRRGRDRHWRARYRPCFRGPCANRVGQLPLTLPAFRLIQHMSKRVTPTHQSTAVRRQRFQRFFDYRIASCLQKYERSKISMMG